MLRESQSITALMAQYRRLQTDRATRDRTVEEMLAYTFPAKTGKTRPFARRYDATGMLNAQRCVAGCVNQLTPPSRRWFLLQPPAGSAAAHDVTYTQALAADTETLHASLIHADAYPQFELAYAQLMTGASMLAVGHDPDGREAFTLSARPHTEWTHLADERGRPHTVFRERAMTAAEAADLFGADALPRELQDALRKLAAGAYIETRPYLNVQRRNREYDPAAVTVARYPYSDLWIDPKDSRVLRRGGVRRLRYIIGQWSLDPAARSPMGPTDMAYGAIRCLDKTMELFLKFAASRTHPPTIWPDGGAFHPMSTKPGAQIVGRMTSMDRGQPTYLSPPGDHRLPMALVEYYGQMVAAIYLSEIFQALTDNKQRTAREVATLVAKNYDTVVPVFGRLKSSLFTPLIRVLLEMQTEFELGVQGWRYGGADLPEFEYDLDIISPMGLAVKYAELQKLDDFLVLMDPVAQIRPEVWDHYSLDDIAMAIGENLAVPRQWRAGPDQVRRLRAKRDELAQQEFAMTQARLAAGTSRDLAKGAEADSPLAALMGQEAS